jgi:hypothetical protein
MSMCACLGPQNGQPLCPCKMRAAEEYQRGHYSFTPNHVGCICPPTSEQTCQSPMCPRKNPFHQRPQHGGTGDMP